jgi:hypothetical protein
MTQFYDAKFECPAGVSNDEVDVDRPLTAEEEREEIDSMRMEMAWRQGRYPYFKIYPGVLGLFCGTKLAVPGRYFRSPFRLIGVRFPVNHGLSCLASRDGMTAEAALLGNVLKHELGPDVQLWLLHIRWGDPSGIRPPVFTRLDLDQPDAVTLDDQLATSRRNPGIDAFVPAMDTVFRVVCATCFLSTGGDKLVEPDVLNKHVERLTRASTAVEVSELHEKAKNRGKFGWTIGRRERVFPNPIYDSTKGPPTERELHYQHQRCGHFHVVRYGANREQWRVQWYRQTTVRPDLPAPPSTDFGYRSARVPNQQAG